MNSKSLRRLAADHGSLHTAGLPPNYLFPPSSDPSADLTSLDILLAGPIGTPYASGVWRLHLDIPATYPTAPPTARFLTRLWHPNIDEATGAVCVETLKRDWSPTLKLRDVLVTISCLLIQPNPASALNEAAGKLAVEDWEGYCRRARLMTGIHAGVPPELVGVVGEAQRRGEVEDGGVKEKGKEKERERVKITPAGPKLQRQLSEDEENRRARGVTLDLDGDAEEEWIPGPGDKTRRRENNIFGIKGLEGGMHVASPPKRIFAANHADTASRTDNEKDKENIDDADPFTTITSKRNAQTSPSISVAGALTEIETETETQTPDLLKFSHRNPFAAIQLNNQTHPLFQEFSYSWEDAMVLHNAGVGSSTHNLGSGGDVVAGGGGGGGMTKADVRKRLAGEEFEKKRRWEMKRLRRAGGDLKRFNRGDFGARTGVGRL